MEPRRLLEVFRLLTTGVLVGVRTREEWRRWQEVPRLKMPAVTDEEFGRVMGMTLAEVDAALAPLRPPEE
jgi:hypothetical protein